MKLLNVRYARKTGLNKKLSKKMASVQLDNTWLGKRVFVVEEDEMRQLMWKLRKALLVIKKIRIICEKEQIKF